MNIVILMQNNGSEVYLVYGMLPKDFTTTTSIKEGRSDARRGAKECK